MSKQYKTIVYIGRFQPLHNAHLATIQHAATLAEQVIVVIGSSNQPRDGDNPFTQQERQSMIAQSCEGLDAQLDFVYAENTTYNNMLWAANVSRMVSETMIGSDAQTKLIGHNKDESSFYLKMFPQWGEPLEMPLVEVLDASTIRQLYFSDKCNLNFFLNVCPQPVLAFLERFRETEEYRYVCFEVDYIENYKKPYANLPYPVSFNTGDAVVFKSGHVLLVKRRSQPGKGLWAFPGGFLNAKTDATLQDCAVRELYEETKIKVPEAVIRGCIREEKIFDAIKRSRRGRIITTAQHIVLPDDDRGLPKVKGSDDAEHAEWVPFHALRRIQMFEDHYDIFCWFMGKV